MVMLLAAFTTGCIQVEQRLALNADGSGTLKIRYTVPDETTQRVKTMLRLTDELAAAGGDELRPSPADDFTLLVFDPTEAALRGKLETYAPLGLQINDLKVQSRNARREVEIGLAFTNLATIATADFFRVYGFSMVRTTPQSYTWFTQSATRDPLANDWNAEDHETYKMVAPLLGGFLFMLEVQMPTPILKTNADRHSQYQATWTFDFNADRNAVARLQRQPMTIIVNAEGLTLPDIRQVPGDAPASPP